MSHLATCSPQWWGIARHGEKNVTDDASRINVAADLEGVVPDQRKSCRAFDANARRRQRRYKRLLTQQMVKFVGDEAGGLGDDDDFDMDDDGGDG